jgi:ABC-type transport system substrate-binding protein
MMSRARAWLIPAVLGAVLVTAGCLGGARTSPTRPAATAGQPTPTSGPRSTPSGGGGTLTRLWVDPPTLDPHLTSDTDSAPLVYEIFSGLVSISTDLQIIPDIAERWDITGGGTVFTFHLRGGVKFQDGKPVTANDIKYSFERALDPRTQSPTADTYLGDIVGAQDKLKGLAKDVKGVKVINDRTVEITNDAPKAYFIAKLTYPTSFVVDRQNVESGADWTRKPNGTGPFKLAEYTPGQRLVLQRNDNYYRGVAKLDRVVNILSGGTAMTMYENNEIDITGVGLADLDRVLNPNDALNKQLVVGPPSFEIGYIGFHAQKPPFDDPLVRRALTLAIDKGSIAKDVLSNRVVPAYGVLPPGFPGYNANLKGLRFDPARAKQIGRAHV